MGKKKTTEQYVQEANQVHSGFYSYLKTIYTKSTDKVVITCPIHDDFICEAASHLQGVGCFECGKNTRWTKRKPTLEDRISEANKVHNNAYDYSLILEYKDGKTKYPIICKEHSVFWQQMDNHLMGQSCPLCARERTRLASVGDIANWIADLKIQYNNKYDYSLITEYVKSHVKVPIICPDHGVFEMSFNSHRSGHQCPSCSVSGYNAKKPGHLYVLVSDKVTKVGITNRKVADRLKQINNSKGGNPFEIVTFFHFKNGGVARSIETQVLSWLAQHYQPVQEVFDGSTECFVDVNLQDLLSFISQFKQN